MKKKKNQLFSDNRVNWSLYYNESSYISSHTHTDTHTQIYIYSKFGAKPACMPPIANAILTPSVMKSECFLASRQHLKHELVCPFQKFRCNSAIWFKQPHMYWIQTWCLHNVIMSFNLQDRSGKSAIHPIQR